MSSISGMMRPMSDTMFADIIAEEISAGPQQVRAALALFAEGSTTPFIARYRKEATGNLDENALTDIRDRHKQLADLEKRRTAICKSVEEQGKMTADLRTSIGEARTMAELEDLYLPFRPRRKTKGSIARDKGLEPLAEFIFQQTAGSVKDKALHFVSQEKGVADTDEAIQGAKDIISEWINEDAEHRKVLRILFGRKAFFHCKVKKGKEEEGIKYKDYFDWAENVNKTPSHRILAARRGEAEGILTLRIEPGEEEALGLLGKLVIRNTNESAAMVRQAMEDSYRRLIRPSLEREYRQETKKRADETATDVFAKNLKDILLAPPLGQKRTLAIDPGFRTGCKIVCLSPSGDLLENTTIYPLPPRGKVTETEQTLKKLVKKHNIEYIVIGNGTGGREALSIIRKMDLPGTPPVVTVNESGASVYSASKLAQKEFPHQDVTVRGAVSIGRRLMDPLSELVKIDPKSIGVGQYQHDVDQKLLKQTLEDVVVHAVNMVGVEVNTASPELLRYVAGLSPRLAESITSYRRENGPFSGRNDLLKVPGMGAKSFEQCAGFLRIKGGGNPLDASGVHPESYHIVSAMTEDLEIPVHNMMGNTEILESIDPEKYITSSAGIPTIRDILSELKKPGRDPREHFEAFSYTQGVNTMEDLYHGLVAMGTVTNITAFGAFIDIGVHQDGLVHISQMADHFVSSPHEEVYVGQGVTVTVLDVDVRRNRIQLSMKQNKS